MWMNGPNGWARLLPLDEACPVEHRDACINRFRISAAVLRTHEEKRFPGGIIASLSIPWGFAKGDEDLGGYHLTWPRDLVETAGALIAADAHGDAGRVLHYLQATQEPDGHWAQNMWLDGRPYWNGVQMDETALPILLVDLAYREGAIDDHELSAALAHGAWRGVVHRVQWTRHATRPMGGRSRLFAIHAGG